MCGRSSLTKTEKELEIRFQATFYREEIERYNPLPNYNAAPTQLLPVILEGDMAHFHLYRWGLVPFWAKDLAVGSRMINARGETLQEKAAFRNLLGSKRCIVPLDGFYEWKRGEKGVKTPYRITTTDQEIFSTAGLWDKWTDPQSGTVWHTFTIITTTPNALMAGIHDRMPAILLKETEKDWLDPEVSANDALQLIGPYPAECMTAYEVSSLVNNVRNRSKEVIDPVGAPKYGIQGTLFEE